MRRGLAMMAVILVVFGCISGAPARAEQGSDQTVKAMQDEERRILTELETLERRIDRIEDRLVRLEGDRKGIKERVTQGSEEIDQLSDRISQMRERSSARLRAIYMMRHGGLLEALLSAKSISDLLNRYRYLTMILNRDWSMIREQATQSGRLSDRLALMKQDRLALERSFEETEAERIRLIENRKEKTALLMKVHQKKELYLAMIRSQEESRQNLIQEVIIRPGRKDAPEAKVNPPRFQTVSPEIGQSGAGSENIASAPPKEPDQKRKWPDFSGQKGRIPRPVPGRIVRGFGKGRDRFNLVITRNGLVFRTKSGTQVRAVMAGEVIYTGWLRGYGNILILDHGNRFYTLTGGLSGIRPQVGQWVGQGEVVGAVPKGGQNDKKDIYFEIRHGARALDPADWLGKKPAV